jgi:hypothetical protein
MELPRSSGTRTGGQLSRRISGAYALEIGQSALTKNKCRPAPLRKRYDYGAVEIEEIGACAGVN